jgi:hypothetical protein
MFRGSPEADDHAGRGKISRDWRFRAPRSRHLFQLTVSLGGRVIVASCDDTAAINEGSSLKLIYVLLN